MAAPPPMPGALVFTDEQLTLLGDLAGRSGFPGARRPQLDQAGWTAVAQGLVARGIIYDDEPSAAARLVDAVLGVVLHADRWLWITVTDRDDEARSGQEILWLDGELRVRQSVTSNGFHHFSTARLDELVAEVLALVADLATQEGATHTLTDAELGLFLAGAQQVLSFDASMRVGEYVEGEVLTIAETANGLWLVRDRADGSIAVEAITPADAGERAVALAATLAEDSSPPLRI